MCWQHIQRWSFWSKRVIMQIASSSSMARFHYIFQRSQETSQQLKHFCITKTQSSEDLPAGFAIAIKDLIFKNDLPRQLQRLSWWNHPLLSAPMQTTDFWTYWRSWVTCRPLRGNQEKAPPKTCRIWSVLEAHIIFSIHLWEGGQPSPHQHIDTMD